MWWVWSWQVRSRMCWPLPVVLVMVWDWDLMQELHLSPEVIYTIKFQLQGIFKDKEVSSFHVHNLSYLFWVGSGLDELCRLAMANGANPLTLSGLAGVGDIVLTCTGDLSRNRTVGMRLGKGEKLADILSSMTAVAEGVLTSKSAHALAEKIQMDCPVVDTVYKVCCRTQYLHIHT